MISLLDVQQARERISQYVKRTPTAHSRTISEMLGVNVYLKLELFQTTGAFKVRGAFNKILSELQHARRSGVVAVSGGNHAQAVAYAGRVLGCRTVVLTHRSTPRNYLDATRGYGAEVIQLEDISEAFAKAHDYEEQGMLFVHPFDDPLVMAGQGTLGLEILEDVPGVTDVFVSIGGGGLMRGVPPHTGRGGWTWYTGSAGWMYRLITESLLGLRLEVDKLRFAPCLPPDWPSLPAIRLKFVRLQSQRRSALPPFLLVPWPWPKSICSA